MELPPKETVIIVHGTWSAPEPGVIQWHQPVNGTPAAAGFIARLDNALQKRGSPARCWAHCTQGSPAFRWSGENSWVARTTAASSLGDYVVRLQQEGWRCHIVAHSHGGNVVSEAFSQILAAAKSLWSPGRIVTLGTPFIDTMSPITKRRKRKAWISDFAFTLLGVVLLAPLYFAITSHEGRLADFFFDPIKDILVLAAVFSLAGLALLVRRRFGHAIQSRFSRASGDVGAKRQSLFLAIGSKVDEAWQVLYHLRNMNNPLAVRSNLLFYVFSIYRSNVSSRSAIARIHGARSYRDLGLVGKLALLLAHGLTLLSVIVLYYFLPMLDAMSQLDAAGASGTEAQRAAALIGSLCLSSGRAISSWYDLGAFGIVFRSPVFRKLLGYCFCLGVFVACSLVHPANCVPGKRLWRDWDLCGAPQSLAGLAENGVGTGGLPIRIAAGRATSVLRR